MKGRLRNLLNWVAFGLIPVFLLACLDQAHRFDHFFEDVVFFFFESGLSDAETVAAFCLYTYITYLAVQYVVWKDVVLLPWRYKVEDE